jgi:hypothetical protein
MKEYIVLLQSSGTLARDNDHRKIRCTDSGGLEAVINPKAAPRSVHPGSFDAC